MNDEKKLAHAASAPGGEGPAKDKAAGCDAKGSRLDLKALRKLCEEATPGPWRVVAHEHGTATSLEPNVMWFEDDGGDLCPTSEDLDFIAAANPATVLRLLDLVDSLRRDLNEEIRDGQRGARDAYAEGREAERQARDEGC
jgi:hypothetical protein